MKKEESYGKRQKIGLFAGPLLFAFISFLPVTEGLTVEGKYVLAATAWMAVWWISEAVPLAVTALLPIIIFPIMDVVSMEEAAKPYANPNAFLIMGGFMLAVTLERWNLHKRLALHIILITGTSPDRLVLGFMLATAFLSMWISNTATTMMILPIAIAVIKQIADLIKESEEDAGRFATCLLLSVGYAGAIGGMATLIGTPPNIVFASFVQQQSGIDITFFDWFIYALPIAITFLIISWVFMTKIAFPSPFKELKQGKEMIENEKEDLGPISDGERGIAIVFSLVALAWISRSFLIEQFVPGITDAAIAVIGIILTFVYPVDFKKGVFLNSWDNALKIPWGILLLLGGGLSLANAFIETELADWIGMNLSQLQNMPVMLILFIVVLSVSLLSNITSNTATTSVMLPIAATLGAAMALDDPLALMIATTTAASFAFMLPVAAPPITIIFGSGYVKLTDMVKYGAILQFIAIIIITIFVTFWMPFVWDF